jgi:DNA repair protein RadC
VILFHNHPSGDPSPSRDDVAVTRQLIAAGTLLGIQVVDHVVLGTVTYFSFSEDKLL